MITVITTEIVLSNDELKEAVKDWLHKKDISNDNIEIDFFDGDSWVDITAKVTFTK